MAKLKTSINDFMDLMDEEESSSERAAFSPKPNSKSENNHEPIMSQSGAKRTTQPEPQPEPSPPYSSSNDFDKKNTITTGADVLSVPENLRRFGISTVNLQNLINSGKATQEVIERSLGALSFDVENGKTGNLANIFFGVLGTGREYISQKYSESLQQELEQELKRLQETEDYQKRLSEIKLQEKFRTYVSQNPQFIESIRNKNNIFVTNQELVDKVALEEFKTLESIQNASG